MTIKKLLKKEKLTEKFIDSGGKTTVESGKTLEDKLMRVTLRIPKEMIEEIDKNRRGVIGNISRNTWILQALLEQIKKK